VASKMTGSQAVDATSWLSAVRNPVVWGETPEALPLEHLLILQRGPPAFRAH
jgi:hypothetical protein